MTPTSTPGNRESSKSGPGRPRDPERGRAIRQATLDLLGEHGYQGLTMADVARRAGVSKTTIYRRWPTKAEVVLNAVAQQLEPAPLAQTDDAVADLRRLIDQFYRRVLGQVDGVAPIAPAELLQEAEVVEAFHAHFVRPMRPQAIALVERAIEQGQLRPDLDPEVLVDTLAAPALYKSLALGERAEAEMAASVFDLVMQGAQLD